MPWFRIRNLFLFFLLAACSAVRADVSVSKTNGYVVLGPPEGTSISKMNGYAVVGPPAGVSISKANGYAVVGPGGGVSVSKANGYAVVGPAPGVSISKAVGYAVVIRKKQPTSNIFTQVPQSKCSKNNICVSSI